MKLLIVGPASPENLNLEGCARDRGHEVSLFSIKSLGFHIDNNGARLLLEGVIAPRFDCCLFRGLGKHASAAKAFARLLKKEGTVIVDDMMDKENFGANKLLTQVLYQLNGLAVIDTYHFQDLSSLDLFKDKLPEPMLIKDTRGKKSKNIFRLENKEAFLDFFKERNLPVANFLIQRVIPAKEDYRVFVVGDKVLGAMKRLTYLNIDKKNIARKDRATSAKVTKELSEFALKAARVAGVEIAGVDIIYDGMQLLLLEVNRAPMFTRFTKVMSLNVAEEIIKYLEKKVQNQK